MSLHSEGGAGGSGFYAFAVTNDGAACQLGGYFGVSVYDRQGHAVSLSDHRQGGSRSLSLAHDERASFLVQVGENPVGKATSCPKIGAFHLIPPNTTTFVQVSLPATPAHLDCTSQVYVYADQQGSAGFKP
jgi:hypothetical protein